MNKLLIANRGEIAVRIMRTCREMGIRTVAVYSDADAEALHVKLADEAVRLGAAESSHSYLNQHAVLQAASETGAEAIHPGYGFLSERAGFSDACAAAGLIFIGPSGDAMRALGDKISAKKLAQSVGVPIVPGFFDAAATFKDIEAASSRIGYPVMLKASAGGGGRGMRIVRDPEELEAQFQNASAEAMNAFGDGTMMVEKYINRPRHIEVQILADQHGTIATLFERECSIQRRHQKLIEEAPSPLMLRRGELNVALGARPRTGLPSPPLAPEGQDEGSRGRPPTEGPAETHAAPEGRPENSRSASGTDGLVEKTAAPEGRAEGSTATDWDAMRAAARKIAQAAGYTNAGTVEFIVDPATGDFYFLEVNARLQVEHPVTEAITGLDLVRWQIRVAQGERLDLPPGLLAGDRTAIRGHALEVRVIAEDPARQFLPSIGRLLGWAPPLSSVVRVDSGFAAGSEVSPHYDSMLAKVIVHGETREEAIARVETALEDFHVLGVKTNIAYLLAVIRHPSFVAGQIDTGFLEREFHDWSPELPAQEIGKIAERASMSKRSEAPMTVDSLPASRRTDGFRNARA